MAGRRLKMTLREAESRVWSPLGARGCCARLPSGVDLLAMDANDGRALEEFESDWTALRMHHQRGALFVLEAGMDPLEVARAIASDAIDVVRGHLESGRLRRPSVEEAEQWSAAPDGHRFRFYIVQPYVVARSVGAAPGAPTERDPRPA